MVFTLPTFRADTPPDFAVRHRIQRAGKSIAQTAMHGSTLPFDSIRSGPSRVVSSRFAAQHRLFASRYAITFGVIQAANIW